MGTQTFARQALSSYSLYIYLKWDGEGRFLKRLGPLGVNTVPLCREGEAKCRGAEFC